VRVSLAEAVDSDGRESYLRARLSAEADGRTLATLAGHQGSGNLHGLSQADALIVLPAGVQSLPAGSEVEAWLLP
jgi:molybdopterin molybdotransferase